MGKFKGRGKEGQFLSIHLKKDFPEIDSSHQTPSNFQNLYPLMTEIT